jgi:hypothetical protein
MLMMMLMMMLTMMLGDGILGMVAAGRENLPNSATIDRFV